MGKFKVGPYDRFMSYVKKTPTCWLWTGAKFKTGYGNFYYIGKSLKAHRWAYRYWVGPIGDKLVCHSCDVRACVNPGHLFLGANLDNIKDAMRKGRLKGVPRPNLLKKKCIRGHQMKDPNLYYWKNLRWCKKCIAIRNEINNAKR